MRTRTSPVNKGGIDIPGAVLHLLEWSCQFRVDDLTLEETREILTRMRRYNNIPADIGELPYAVRRGIGPVIGFKSEPENGTCHNLKFTVGNEGSLVVYVRSQLNKRQGDTFERQTAVLLDIGRRFNADEVDANEDLASGILTARYWWD
jgi:hypothetical protein